VEPASAPGGASQAVLPIRYLAEITAISGEFPVSADLQ
jgi:hypothetical protein